MGERQTLINVEITSIIDPNTGTEYVLGEKVRQGGSSLIYHVQNKSDGLFYVLKECYPAVCESLKRKANGELFVEKNPFLGADNTEEIFNKFKELAKRERDTLNKIATLHGNNDDYILPSRSCFEKNNTVYTLICTADGETLAEKIDRWDKAWNTLLPKKRKEALKEVFNCIDGVLEAANNLHLNGYLHNDISPENIYISNAGWVRLIDFNSAYKIGADEEDMNCKTFSYREGYSAHELIMHAKGTNYGNLSIETDTFSIAAIVFRIFVGRPLTNMDKLYANEWRLSTKSPACKGLQPAVVETLNHLIQKGISNQPKKRMEFTSLFEVLKKQLNNEVGLASELIKNKSQALATAAELDIDEKLMPQIKYNGDEYKSIFEIPIEAKRYILTDTDGAEHSALLKAWWKSCEGENTALYIDCSLISKKETLFQYLLSKYCHMDCDQSSKRGFLECVGEGKNNFFLLLDNASERIIKSNEFLELLEHKNIIAVIACRGKFSLWDFEIIEVQPLTEALIQSYLGEEYDYSCAPKAMKRCLRQPHILSEFKKSKSKGRFSSEAEFWWQLVCDESEFSTQAKLRLVLALQEISYKLLSDRKSVFTMDDLKSALTSREIYKRYSNLFSDGVLTEDFSIDTEQIKDELENNFGKFLVNEGKYKFKDGIYKKVFAARCVYNQLLSTAGGRSSTELLSKRNFPQSKLFLRFVGEFMCEQDNRICGNSLVLADDFDYSEEELVKYDFSDFSSKDLRENRRLILSNIFFNVSKNIKGCTVKNIVRIWEATRDCTNNEKRALKEAQRGTVALRALLVVLLAALVFLLYAFMQLHIPVWLAPNISLTVAGVTKPTDELILLQDDGVFAVVCKDAEFVSYSWDDNSEAEEDSFNFAPSDSDKSQFIMDIDLPTYFKNDGKIHTLKIRAKNRFFEQAHYKLKYYQKDVRPTVSIYYDHLSKLFPYDIATTAVPVVGVDQALFIDASFFGSAGKIEKVSVHFVSLFDDKEYDEPQYVCFGEKNLVYAPDTEGDYEIHVKAYAGVPAPGRESLELRYPIAVSENRGSWQLLDKSLEEWNKSLSQENTIKMYINDREIMQGVCVSIYSPSDITYEFTGASFSGAYYQKGHYGEITQITKKTGRIDDLICDYHTYAFFIDDGESSFTFRYRYEPPVIKVSSNGSDVTDWDGIVLFDTLSVEVEYEKPIEKIIYMFAKRGDNGEYNKDVSKEFECIRTDENARITIPVSYQDGNNSIIWYCAIAENGARSDWHYTRFRYPKDD